MAGALAAVIAVGTAIAAPQPDKSGIDAIAGSAVTKVHQGCHYDNRWSPGFGWHNHSNSDCRPEAPRPRPRPGYGYGYEPKGYGYGPGGHSGHRENECHYDCRYSPIHGWHNHSNAQCRPEPCRR
ncbi:MAG TPA: hypothetical protein PK264_06580 [Hyphomicrobiaceae bacterium]|nr:hypothetical protein [Hyphomicrobiaceae bacterium]